MKSYLRKALLYAKAFATEVLCGGQVVKMSAYFDLRGRLMKENWGDDINYWFFRDIVDKPIVSYDWSLLTRCTDRPYVMGIGSLLTLVPLDHSIVWGSGVMSATAPFRGRPAEVRAVRGPLSRKRLLDAGIECPEVYGDPALLLPSFYPFPQVEKKYKLGIIPHYKDRQDPLFDRFKNDNEVRIIEIRNYGHWLDFIDDICRCEAIASTSLHGLIVSEAYGVPNLWINMTRREPVDEIKYHDFFLSMGQDRRAVSLTDGITKDDLLCALGAYRKGHIDLQPLIDACPFRLKPNARIRR